MNKNSTFGIGLSLATMLVFTAPAMAEPNTAYFEPIEEIEKTPFIDETFMQD